MRTPIVVGRALDSLLLMKIPTRSEVTLSNMDVNRTCSKSQHLHLHLNTSKKSHTENNNIKIVTEIQFADPCVKQVKHSL